MRERWKKSEEEGKYKDFDGDVVTISSNSRVEEVVGLGVDGLVAMGWQERFKR